MRLTLLCAAAILGSSAANAQNDVLIAVGQQAPGTQFKVARGPVAAAMPSPSGSFLGGGGTCASPTVIPSGPTAVNFPFDNTLPASAGATNAFEALCAHSGQLGIDQEEWWSWVAASTGVARMSTCTGIVGIDTKIAIYADDCPNITTLDPLSCKDDDPTCPGFETTITWDITAGTNYLIQLGTFAGSPGGAGDFSIEELPATPAGQYDVTGPQNSLGLGATGGEMMWLQVFDAGVGETLNSIDTAFGTVGQPVDPDGTPANIAVYQGDPFNGLTLLGTEAIVSANSATGLTTNYPLTTPIAVTGLYTVGVRTTVSPTSRPSPGDYTVNSRGRTWVTWDTTGATIDLVDPTTAAVPPVEVQNGLNGANDQVWVLRVNTTLTTPAFAEFCFGDGGDQMGCTDCPCSNNAPVGSGGGCLNSGGTGSRLIATGDTSVSLAPAATTDLRFSMTGGPASQLFILNSGDGLAPADPMNPCFGLGSGAAGAAFDGLRCAIQGTLRNGGRGADTNGEVGVTNNPWGGESNPPGGIAQFFGYGSGVTKYFQCIHRDSTAVNCGTGLNTTQAIEVTFTP